MSLLLHSHQEFLYLPTANVSDRAYELAVVIKHFLRTRPTGASEKAVREALWLVAEDPELFCFS